MAQYNKQEIGDLLTRLQEGDTEAFGILYEKTGNIALMQARLYSKDAAEDIVQDAYVKAYTHINQIRKPEDFGAWLKMIVANTAKEYIRKESRYVTESELETERESDENEKKNPNEYEKLETRDFLPEEKVDYTDTKEIIWGFIEQLPVAQKSVIDLCYYQGMSVDQTSKILNISPGTVKSRLFVARQKLMGMIEGEEKRSGIRLHCSAATLVPFIIWLLSQKEEEAMLAKPMLPKSVWDGIVKGIVKAEGRPPVGKKLDPAGDKNPHVSKGPAKHLPRGIRNICIGAAATAVVATGGLYLYSSAQQDTPPVQTVMETEAATETEVPTQAEPILETAVEETEMQALEFPFSDEEVLECIINSSNIRTISGESFYEEIDKRFVSDMSLDISESFYRGDLSTDIHATVEYTINENVTRTEYFINAFCDLDGKWKLGPATIVESEVVSRNLINIWKGRMRIDDPSKEIIDPAYFADRDVTLKITGQDGIQVTGQMIIVDDIYGFYHESDIVGTFEDETLRIEMMSPIDNGKNDYVFVYRYDKDSFEDIVYGGVLEFAPDVADFNFYQLLPETYGEMASLPQEWWDALTTEQYAAAERYMEDLRQVEENQP